MLNRWVRPALERGRVAWVRQPLDAERMHAAARALLGEHDFSSFRAVGCQAKSPVREIHHLSVTRQGSEVIIDIEANAFVYHMVRNVAGTLMPVGKGERSVTWPGEVLAAPIARWLARPRRQMVFISWRRRIRLSPAADRQGNRFPAA